MNRSKTIALFCVGAMMAGALAGCGSKGSDQAQTPGKTASSPTVNKPKDPIELTMVPYFLALNDDEFQKYIAGPVHEKFPYITMKLDRTDPTKLAASGSFPDMYYVANSRYTTFSDLDIPWDMSALVKSNKLDLTKFSSPNIDWVKGLGKKGEIFGLPFDLNQIALFYNKDIFDKKGVAYPKDGMTFDDVLNLSKKLTFKDGDTQYFGFLPPRPEYFARIRSLPFVDDKTNKALVDNPAMKAILELDKSFFEVPGIVNNNQYPPKNADFIKNQTVAMKMDWMTDFPSNMAKAKVTMNFDLVGAPSFKDLPKTTVDPGAKMMGISKTSKHKEDAFQVLQYLTSPEIQTLITRNGRLTVLADESIRKQFEADVAVMKGKNIAGGLSVKPAKMAPPNTYTAAVTAVLNKSEKDLALGTKDVNTILREDQELADKAIQDQIAKNKK